MEKKAKKDKAFEAIYNGNAHHLYYIAFYYTKNHFTSEELVQATFAKFYQHMENVQEEKAVAWLNSTTRHMSLNSIRDHKREVLIDDFELLNCELMSIEHLPEESFFQKLCEQENKKLKEEMLTELYHVNPRWYEAITVTYLMKKPQREVAEAMGITFEGLRSMLRRARVWMKTNYKSQIQL